MSNTTLMKQTKVILDWHLQIAKELDGSPNSCLWFGYKDTGMEDRNAGKRFIVFFIMVMQFIKHLMTLFQTLYVLDTIAPSQKPCWWRTREPVWFCLYPMPSPQHMGHHVFMSLKASATQRLGCLAISAGVIMEKPSMHEGKPNQSLFSHCFTIWYRLCQKVKAWFVSLE